MYLHFTPSCGGKFSRQCMQGNLWGPEKLEPEQDGWGAQPWVYEFLCNIHKALHHQSAHTQVREVQNVPKLTGRAANVLTLHLLRDLFFFFFFLFSKQPKLAANEQLQRLCRKLLPSLNNFWRTEEECVGSGRECDVSLRCQPEGHEIFLCPSMLLPPACSFFLSPPTC